MSDAALQMRGPVGGTTDAKKVAVGSSVGAVIETYDFIGFGTAAALYFGTAFFPSENPVTGTLAAFATLGVGFAARPLGGILGGHLGDRVGRKPVLVASLIVMGLSTFAIGLLPTYATVGVLAPVLLVLVRIIQGLAFGAEWGGAILMAYEHAPWRAKGRYTGIVQAGFPVGLLLANLVFLFSVHLGDALAWRVPFLASIILVAVGLVIRAKVPESPVFEEVKEAGTIAKSPIMDSIRYDWKNILRGIGLRIAETAGYAVSITYMISYLNTNELTTRIQTLTALCIAAALGIGATLGWAALTDKIGRRPLYLAVTAFGVLWGVGMFVLANTGIVILIGLAIVISYTVSQNALAGAQGAWFPELFTAARRASGASMAYQISAMVSGFTPFITTLLYLKFGWVGPALLFSMYALIGLIAALLTRETFGRAERELAAAASAEPGARLRGPPAARTHHPHHQGAPSDHDHRHRGRSDRPSRRGAPLRVPDAARRAEHGRGAGSGLRRPGVGRGRRPCRRLRQPAPLSAPTTRTGTGGTGSCCPPATTRSASTPPWPRPASCRSPSSPRTVRTTRGCRCRGWRATRPEWRSPAARWVTVCQSPSGSPWGCATAATRLGSTTSVPMVS